jgi:hypothetical protein
MASPIGGNGVGMHQLGFELPERTGFGGLWDAIAESTSTETGAVRRTAGDVECEPTVVAVCDGPTSTATRATIAAFRRECEAAAAAA